MKITSGEAEIYFYSLRVCVCGLVLDSNRFAFAYPHCALGAMSAIHGPCAPSSRISTGKAHLLRNPVRLNTKLRNGKGSGGRQQQIVECKAEAKQGGRSYFNFTGFPFPLGPLFDRRTIRKEVNE